MEKIPSLLREIRTAKGMSLPQLAQALKTSIIALDRWERGAGTPSPEQRLWIEHLHKDTTRIAAAAKTNSFASRGNRLEGPDLFSTQCCEINLAEQPGDPILSRLNPRVAGNAETKKAVTQLSDIHKNAAATASNPPDTGMSAGKNTYTYDAHTYHTKVPPQGIAELLKHYLPEGGLLLDPFAGSGMTGVAAQVVGCDCILNELSPAAGFIADRFTSKIPADHFMNGVEAVLQETKPIRTQLYSTQCRECGQSTELLYTVWSYRMECNHCHEQFTLWDHCRSYGKRVREHKILPEFPCPVCHTNLKKSRLKRLTAVPVEVGYKCCGSKQTEVTHPPDANDLALIAAIYEHPPLANGFYPTNELPDGVNLRQPRNHGLDRIDKFYTPRNLAAMSQLWASIHRIEDAELAGFLAFVFTSLYQRVTQLSEFRFWGGSSNTANFNVPTIFNETNVFLTFKRKAKSIYDHLSTTAIQYHSKKVVINGSATDLQDVPTESVDMIFTDPPFGANINYSEMNFLWESWLGQFTDNKEEAIVNRVQGKDVSNYQALMTRSLQECYRVLRSGHWLLLVFMNSSQAIWDALRFALLDAGFSIEKVDIFDKQHGTFKQFVSENTAGCDLVLHCRKIPNFKAISAKFATASAVDSDVHNFLSHRTNALPTSIYHHVARTNEIDYRQLYSEWLAQTNLAFGAFDFAHFRRLVDQWQQNSRSV